jgi:hypothetical protein
MLVGFVVLTAIFIRAEIEQSYLAFALPVLVNNLRVRTDLHISILAVALGVVIVLASTLAVFFIFLLVGVDSLAVLVVFLIESILVVYLVLFVGNMQKKILAAFIGAGIVYLIVILINHIFHELSQYF